MTRSPGGLERFQMPIQAPNFISAETLRLSPTSRKALLGPSEFEVQPLHPLPFYLDEDGCSEALISTVM